MSTTASAATDIPTVQRTEHKVAAHIRDAAQATGVPFEFLLAQANQESRLNPDAKSSRSSAMGLFQFTSGTWLDMVKKHGAAHGLDKYADAVITGSDGRLTVADKDLKKEILDLRRDPKLSALMAAEYAKDNEHVLESRLGRQVSTHDLYLAHFLGAGGALKVLKGRHEPEGGEQPDDMAGAAKANPEVFVDSSSGEQRSLASIYATVERRFRRAMSEAERLAGRLQPQVDLAALRPAERPAEQPAGSDAAADSIALAAADVAARGQKLASPARPSPVTETPQGGDVALVMEGIPATISSFPARLPPSPPRPQAETDLQLFPVPLPPPVTGARTENASLPSLLSANEDQG